MPLVLFSKNGVVGVARASVGSKCHPVKLHTSYYAKVKSLPSNALLFSISIKPPYYIKCGTFDKLSPPRSVLEAYKMDGDIESYTKSYKEQVLYNLSAEDVYNQLCEWAKQKGTDKVFLLCYEGKNKFCHRHLVSEWFRENGIDCTEFEKE